MTTTTGAIKKEIEMTFPTVLDVPSVNLLEVLEQH
jgi:hypothetical protein